MLKEVNQNREPIDVNAIVSMFDCFAIKYMSADKECIVIMEEKHRLADGTVLYTAYYEDGEVDIVCANVNDTFAERFNCYLNYADGVVYACEIVNVECNVEYRIW